MGIYMLCMLERSYLLLLAAMNIIYISPPTSPRLVTKYEVTAIIGKHAS